MLSGAVCKKRDRMERNEAGLLPRTRILPGFHQVKKYSLFMFMMAAGLYAPGNSKCCACVVLAPPCGHLGGPNFKI